MTDRERLLRKADRYLESARLLCNAGDYDSAVSRAYYAAFFVAEALLDALGQSFSSHRGVISAYGQEFAKTSHLDPRFHRLLIAAFEKRQQADYLPDPGFLAADVSVLLEEIAQFRAAALTWLAVEQRPQTSSPHGKE